MNEQEKLHSMQSAEEIAIDIFNTLKSKLSNEKKTLAEGLHIGTFLSACLIIYASEKNSMSIPKEEILSQFIEALNDCVLNSNIETASMN